MEKKVLIFLTLIFFVVMVIGAETQDKDIGLYSGPGGELAEDVAKALDKLDISYVKIDSSDIIKGNIFSFPLLSSQEVKQKLYILLLKEKVLVR